MYTLFDAIEYTQAPAPIEPAIIDAPPRETFVEEPAPAPVQAELIPRRKTTEPKGNYLKFYNYYFTIRQHEQHGYHLANPQGRGIICNNYSKPIAAPTIEELIAKCYEYFGTEVEIFFDGDIYPQ
jgi:hypothetical protein